MNSSAKIPLNPKQILPRQAYICDEWFEREQKELFGKTWAFAGVVMDFPNSGDFKTIQAGPHSLIIIKNDKGDIQGFHNICRHRGTELLEGSGNCGKTIMCPYHNWVYNLDGRLRGLPAQAECFPDMDKKSITLHHAAIAIFNNLIFVHPDEEPEESFETWLGGLDNVPWPHDLSSSDLHESPDDVVYELNCNWKVFFENAVDGYHLAYLHKNTLGGPLHDKNIWQSFARHLVWWSTEREGVKHRIPQFVENAAKGSGAKIAKGADIPGYGGVYMLFPTTILTPNPWGFTISTMEPINADKTLLRVRNWAPKGLMSYTYRAKDIAGFDKSSGLIKSSHWKKHPLETGDFQTEDIWVCEKMQRALHSPKHSVEFMAKGSGGEAALEFFQQCILEYMPLK